MTIDAVEPPVVEEFREIGGIRLRYLTAGEGRPLLYLHGGGDPGAWRQPLGPLSTRFRVIRPDHPGFGESDDLPQMSVAAIAEFYSTMFDELGIEDAIVMGASFGGWVGLELALREPDRVTAFIAVDAVGIVDPDEALAPVFDLDRIQAAELMFPAGPLREAAIERAKSPADPTAAAKSARGLATAKAITSGPPMMSDPTLAGRAGALRIPVTLVWGEADRVVPPIHAQAWLAAIPQARLHIIADAGHGPQNQRPTEFLAATGLLSDARPGAPASNPI